MCMCILNMYRPILNSIKYPEIVVWYIYCNNNKRISFKDTEVSEFHAEVTYLKLSGFKRNENWVELALRVCTK